MERHVIDRHTKGYRDTSMLVYTLRRSNGTSPSLPKPYFLHLNLVPIALELAPNHAKPTPLRMRSGLQLVVLKHLVHTAHGPPR